MNMAVFSLTVREFLGRRRSLLMLLLAAVPVGLAIIFQAADPTDQQDWTANFLMNGTVITLVLPLSCLILGTAALGEEIENGTIIYLLTKPLPRPEIVAGKFAGAAAVALVFVVPATVVSGLIGIQGAPEEGLVVGFTLAAMLGTLAYVAVFLLVSIFTTRALLGGLAYVFIWETLVTELFPATAYLSIRQYCLGIADTVSGVSATEFEAELGSEALVLVAAVTVGALLLSVQRLETLQIVGSE